MEPVHYKDRPWIESAWMDAWKQSGLLCRMVDDQWVIEAVLPDGAKPSRRSHYVDGVEIRYPGAGD